MKEKFANMSQRKNFSTATINVKSMPQHDPDAEISSLTFTIPSWISTMERVRAVTNFRETSGDAQSKLVYQLQNLKYTVDGILSDIIEGGKISG